MKQILWLSQHPALPRQVAELKRLFGEVEVRQDVNPFANAEEITRRYQAGGYDDIMVVAPLSVIQRLCDLGLRPLWGEMEQVQGPAMAEVTVKGRYYRFIRFRRIEGIVIKYDETFDAEYLNPD